MDIEKLKLIDSTAYTVKMEKDEKGNYFTRLKSEETGEMTTYYRHRDWGKVRTGLARVKVIKEDNGDFVFGQNIRYKLPSWEKFIDYLMKRAHNECKIYYFASPYHGTMYLYRPNIDSRYGRLAENPKTGEIELVENYIDILELNSYKVWFKSAIEILVPEIYGEDLTRGELSDYFRSTSSPIYKACKACSVNVRTTRCDGLAKCTHLLNQALSSGLFNANYITGTNEVFLSLNGSKFYEILQFDKEAVGKLIIEYSNINHEVIQNLGQTG